MEIISKKKKKKKKLAIFLYIVTDLLMNVLC